MSPPAFTRTNLPGKASLFPAGEFSEGLWGVAQRPAAHLLETCGPISRRAGRPTCKVVGEWHEEQALL